VNQGYQILGTSIEDFENFTKEFELRQAQIKQSNTAVEDIQVIYLRDGDLKVSKKKLSMFPGSKLADTFSGNFSLE
jgi:hypothetical protein